MTIINDVRNTAAISDLTALEEIVPLQQESKDSYFVDVDNYWSIFYDPKIPTPQRALYSLALVPMIGFGLLGAGCNAVEELPEDVYEDPDHPVDDDDSGFPDNPDECVPEECLGYPDETRMENLGDENPFNDTMLCVDMYEETGSIQSQYEQQLNVNGLNLDRVIKEDGSIEDPHPADEVIVFNYNNPIEVFVYDQTTDSFVDEAISKGLALSYNYTNGTWADYDDDGDTDVLLSGLEGYQLYENVGGYFYPVDDGGISSSEQSRFGAGAWIGNGFVVGSENGLRMFAYDEAEDVFTDNLIEYGHSMYDINSASEIIAEDFNGDGLVDVFVANDTGRDRMFYQNEDGTFTSVEADEDGEAAIGIDITGNDNSVAAKAITLFEESSPSISKIVGDGSSPIYLNQEDGTFVDVAGDYNLNVQGGVLDVAWATYNGDSLSPLFLRSDEPPAFFIQEENIETGMTNFRDMSEFVTLETIAQAKGTFCSDFRSTGYPDCISVYLDNPITRFRNETSKIAICED
jgi:hypothetical protein